MFHANDSGLYVCNSQAEVVRGSADQAELVERTLEVQRSRKAGDAGRLAQLIEHEVLDAPTCRAAIAGLGALRAEKYVPLLTRLLADGDIETRVTAAVALKEISSRESVQTKRLRRWRYRRYAARARRSAPRAT